MWPFRKEAVAKETEREPNMITLHPDDNMAQRVEKALRYSGLANPNRLGTVDSVAFIMGEYERLYGPVYAQNNPAPKEQHNG